MKQLLRISLSLAIIALLIVGSVNFVLAAPPLQDGGNQQQGQDQDDNGDENGDADQDGQQDQQDGQQDQQDGQQRQPVQEQGVQLPFQQQQGPQVVNQDVLANSCAQTYVVQSGDTLSAIANQTLGSNLAWREIVQATNDVAASANLPRIQNPTFILPGQTLCIPSSQPGQQAQQDQAGQMQQDQRQAQQDQMQQDQQGLLPQTGMSAAQGQQLQQISQQLQQISQQLQVISQQLQQQMGQQDQMQQQGQQSTMALGQRVTLPEGQGMLIVENLTDRDLIFNLAGESEEGTDTVWLGPGETATFTLPADTPGQQFSGHEVTGDFGLESGQIELQPGEIVWLACQENSRCEPVALENIPAQLFEQALSGQQQPGQMQQQPGQDDQNGDDGQNGATARTATTTAVTTTTSNINAAADNACARIFNTGAGAYSSGRRVRRLIG